MKKVFFLFCICISLTGYVKMESKRGEYPVINVGNSAGKYRKVYCSDFFSSIELIPLETNNNSLIGNLPAFVVNDSLIFVIPQDPPQKRIVLAFDRSGKFLNQIGRTGQGPDEYLLLYYFYLNTDAPTVFISDLDKGKILEYDYSGKFIGSLQIPRPDGRLLMRHAYAGDNLFVGSINYDSSARYKYFLFDRTGDIVKSFPAYFYYVYNQGAENLAKASVIFPFKIDKQLYLTDYVNDTLYTLVNLDLKPVYVFDFGKYSLPLGKVNKEGQKEIMNISRQDAGSYLYVNSIVGMPKYLFCEIHVPSKLPRPKSRPEFIFGNETQNDSKVYGIYDMAGNTITLLDTDRYLQKGLINDMNGGLSVIPRYYAGNNVIVDFWLPEDMKELLTEEYFASQTIKDRQAHQKLRELLKNLKEDDNPVVVIAKLK